MKILDRSVLLKSFLLLTMQAVATFLHAFHDMYLWKASKEKVLQAASTSTTSQVEESDRCAINLFGLPRAFRSLTLPSLVQNVIALNADCDYFVHYYHVTQEAAGRSGQGGILNPLEIHLLKDAVLQVAVARNESRVPTVELMSDTEAEFDAKYQTLLTAIETNQSLYVPWKDPTYIFLSSTVNIVKMWHSIQSVHQLMEQRINSSGVRYTSVAMLRSDVVYITPLDVRAQGEPHNVVLKDNSTRSSSSNGVTIPAFGQWPVSDRLIYGYPPAVKVWATERLSRLAAHVSRGQRRNPGTGMHSEKFLARTIFPLIRMLNVTIRTHPTLCFVRARVDETVWIDDCARPAKVVAPTIAQSMVGGSARAALEMAIGRSCHGQIQGPIQGNGKVTAKYLNCSL
jgi:hypothetical protein